MRSPAIIDGPLIAEVGHPFASSFRPVNSHLPKYPVDWSLSPGNCLAGSGIGLDPSTGTLSGTPSAPGTFQCVIIAVDTYPTPVTTAQTAFTLVVESRVRRTVHQQRCATAGQRQARRMHSP